MAKTNEEIRKQMEANSKAWHTADAATKKKLEAENQALGKQIGGTYNSASGTWSDSSGNSLYGSSSSPTKLSGSNSQYTGSSNSVATNNNTQQAIKDQMNANSIAWWNADETEKKRLENENQNLAAILGGTVSYDAATGYWRGTAEGATVPKEDILTWEYGGKPQNYQSKYDPEIDRILNEIFNRSDFSYDVANDPLYQQYANMYQREGDRAMRGTLAEAASSAGGMNTYAITAAQQAANYYNSQLNDRIPELYQLAYEMYLQDKESMVQDLGLLQDMDATQYSRYRDTMNDWKDDRDFAYGMYQDDVNQSNWKKEFDYNSMWDSMNFANDNIWKNKEFDAEQTQIGIENDRYDQENAREEILAIIAAGDTPPPELVAKSTMSQATVDALVADEKAKRKGENIKNPISPIYTEPQEIPFDDTLDGIRNYTGDSEYLTGLSDIVEICDELIKTGGWTEVQAALNEARADGLIDQNTFMKLFNKYRDM